MRFKRIIVNNTLRLFNSFWGFKYFHHHRNNVSSMIMAYFLSISCKCRPRHRDYYNLYDAHDSGSVIHGRCSVATRTFWCGHAYCVQVLTKCFETSLMAWRYSELQEKLTNIQTKLTIKMEQKRYAHFQIRYLRISNRWRCQILWEIFKMSFWNLSGRSLVASRANRHRIVLEMRKTFT